MIAAFLFGVPTADKPSSHQAHLAYMPTDECYKDIPKSPRPGK
jgi:hypothetical protein